MFDLSWFELPQLHVFNAWFSGTGKTHVAAAVALAASANLPQKERCQHGRMPLRDEIRLQMLWPFLDFSKNRRHQTRFCNWSWWIMTNIMTYHDISWHLEVSVHEQAHEREILEFTNIWTTCVVLAFASFTVLLLPWVQERVLCVTQSHAAAINLHKRLEVDFHR